MEGMSSTCPYDEIENIIHNGSPGPCSLPLECLRRITNNFSDKRLLGEGGFGKVYKGVLQNGKMVAVKRLDQLLKLGVQERQFQNEVYHLMRLKHPNIVRFLGYCYETRNECVEHDGKYIFAAMQQKLICLEFLPNGSLDRHLFDESSGHEWHIRYKIIKGICCGLLYLHEECQRQFGASIIHLDLKPGNILLDEYMGSKIGDFGLSRLFEDNKTHTCATSLLGSLGYMAPEYLVERIVTVKADIYSLGVIIIEIITGSRVSFCSFSSPTSCKEFQDSVISKWRNRLGGGASSETDCKQIMYCLEIGLGCIKSNREERPTSREIIDKLDRWETTNCKVNNENRDRPAADQILTHMEEKASVSTTGYDSYESIVSAVRPNIGSRRTAAADDNSNTNTGTGLRSYGSPARGFFNRQLSSFTRLLSCFHHQQRKPRRPSSSSSPLEVGYVPDGLLQRGLFRRQLSRVMTRQRSGPSLFKDPAEEFTFAQLEAATKGFALEAKIGEGSFGTVYKGKLPDGREVAIKRACGESGLRAWRFQEKESAFQSELAFLSRVHHKHLVGLVGYCEENDERLLVYEYMKNGALYDHVHPKPAGSAAAPSPVASSWKLRIKILMGASRGIEYLHSYVVPPIIHRDVKSSNILLDGGWTARVSDFGLSLMGPLELSSEDDDSSATATAARLRSRSSSSHSQHLTVTKAAGTVGYMDPESYGLQHLTVKSNVYSLGVVMLEVLTGKCAMFREAEGADPLSVVDYAVPIIVSGELGKVLDPRVPEPAAHEAEAVELVAYTAVHCVRLEGKDRPAMSDIVVNLETAYALCEGNFDGDLVESPSSDSLPVSPVDQD